MQTRAARLTAFVVLGLLLASVYTCRYLPRLQARMAAERFWRAAGRQDIDALRSHLASDSRLSAEAWAERHAGLRFAGRAYIADALANPCGIEFIALGGLHDRDGVPHGGMLLLRREGGRWLVVGGEGRLC